MTWNEHRAAAEKLPPGELVNNIRKLASDPNFNGVVGLLENMREQFVNAGCQQAMAGDGGKLAHCQGSIHALNQVMARIASAIVPPKPQGGIPEPGPERA